MDDEADDRLNNYDDADEDIGYESEEYDDGDEHDADGNNNSTNHKILPPRGITRLSKFRNHYGKPGGLKLKVTFDAMDRLTGDHRALFSSFLGDMVRDHIGLKILSWKKVDLEARAKLWDEITRYFDVEETYRKLVMHRLGGHLRNFRRKLRKKYILPNQNTPSKLNEVPNEYSAIVKASEWDVFVQYRSTEDYQKKSDATKKARSKSVYPHTMGRGGYVHVKKKMIEENVIEAHEEPPRGILWLRGRQNKDGVFRDERTKEKGETLVADGTDGMTEVFGKEKGGYARGVGSGVTINKYFHLSRNRKASDDERVKLLQAQLDSERREREDKDKLI